MPVARIDDEPGSYSHTVSMGHISIDLEIGVETRIFIPGFHFSKINKILLLFSQRDDCVCFGTATRGLQRTVVLDSI